MEDSSWGLETKAMGPVDNCATQPKIPPPNPWIERRVVEKEEKRMMITFAAAGVASGRGGGKWRAVREVYVMGRLGAKLAETEEETQAQNKVVLGLVSALLIFPATFFFVWSMLWYMWIGAVIAAGIVYLFAVSHVRI